MVLVESLQERLGLIDGREAESVLREERAAVDLKVQSSTSLQQSKPKCWDGFALDLSMGRRVFYYMFGNEAMSEDLMFDLCRQSYQRRLRLKVRRRCN
jgi:hypothetical protein